MLARCDALDGATDGLVQDTRACQRTFIFMRDVPTCAGARDGTCLTQAQKIAIAPIFSGATTSNGDARSTRRFPFDSGHRRATAFRSGSSPRRWCSTPARSGTIFKVPPSSRSR